MAARIAVSSRRPARTNDGEWENGNLPTWAWEWDFGARGVQTGSFAACSVDFALQIFQLFHFYTGANSYYPWERKAENGKMEIFQPERESEISVPGAFKLDHLQPVAHLIFQLFHFYTGGRFLLPKILIQWDLSTFWPLLSKIFMDFSEIKVDFKQIHLTLKNSQKISQIW